MDEVDGTRRAKRRTREGERLGTSEAYSKIPLDISRLLSYRGPSSFPGSLFLFIFQLRRGVTVQMASHAPVVHLVYYPALEYSDLLPGPFDKPRANQALLNNIRSSERNVRENELKE